LSLKRKRNERAGPADPTTLEKTTMTNAAKKAATITMHLDRSA
jgi:hypothetical protein